MKSSSKKPEPQRPAWWEILIWLFIIGSLLGFLSEGLWSIRRTGAWENHSALVWGPFCVIYGVGAGLIYFLSAKFKSRGWITRFLVFALVGGALEYTASWLQEIIFGTVSWDYSYHPYNLNGRISPEAVLQWGALGLAFSVLLYPLLEKMFAKMHGQAWRATCIVCGILMAIDCVVTIAATWRWVQRRQEIAPQNAIEIALDNAFPNEYMENVFSNMRFVQE